MCCLRKVADRRTRHCVIHLASDNLLTLMCDRQLHDNVPVNIDFVVMRHSEYNVTCTFFYLSITILLK